MTRRGALAKGLTKYYTGVPCHKGHLAYRRVGNYECIECAAGPARIRAARYYDENRQDANQKSRERYKQRKEYYDVRRKEYRRERKGQINEYFRNKYRHDKDHKIGVAARRMVRRCMESSGIKKGASTWDSIGYSRAQLVDHIERQFKDGMTWGNYGEWHIDHIKPIIAFVRDGIEDLSVINALANLQPLWAFENISKNDKYQYSAEV